MGLIRETIFGRQPERSDPALSLGQYVNEFLNAFTFNGLTYSLPGAKQEDISGSFQLMTRGSFKSDSVVAACIWNRMLLFSEMRFTFRRLRTAGPAGTFNNPDLRILDAPWEGATTGDLLSRMLLYHDIAGNAYVVRRGDRLIPLRPDWVKIVGGVPGNGDASVWHPDAEVLGYLYQEGGPGSGNDPIVLLPEQVAHFAALPDPETRFTGMSWITPVIREVMADKAATDHKLKFFENGATPNLVVKLPTTDLEKMKTWIEVFKNEHYGTANAYKTLFLVEGADAVPVGSDLQQIEFKVTQGAGETRIAAAAGVPPVIAGLSEGLQGSSLNAGNFQAARRRFADMTIRPLWRNACGSLQRVIQTPTDAQLWYDDKDVSALQEDKKDAAEIQMTQAQTIKALIDAGYEADSVVKAVMAEDFSQLTHSGLFSVQLQEPGAATPPTNGNGLPALSA